jgi:Spy/CpxP family protein refolding chaperone
MNQFYLGINLVAALFLAAVLLFVILKGQGGKSAAANAPRRQDYTRNLRVVIRFPPRIIKLLALSTDQKTQLQAIITRAENDLFRAELEKQSALSALQNAIMKAAFDESAVKQRQGELVIANDKRVQVHAEMFVAMRKVLTSEQVTRIRPELPLEPNALQLIVQLPEGFSDIGLSGDQNSQLQALIHSREPRLIALGRKAQAARVALERAIFSERFDEAAVNQRREESVAVIAEEIEVNTGIVFDTRKILTPDQLKRLDELTPDHSEPVNDFTQLLK